MDTGAEVSFIPSSTNDRHHKTKLTLQAVNGSSIPTYATLTLNIGLRRTFRWIFVIADIQNPILDADFLRHFALLVDVKHNRLFDTTSHPRYAHTHYLLLSCPAAHYSCISLGCQTQGVPRCNPTLYLRPSS